MLVLKGILGGSLKITSEIKNNLQGPKNSLKRFLRSPYSGSDLDGQIRANRFADSLESPDSRESFQGSRTEPLSCESRTGAGGKIANCGFEAIRENSSHVMKNRVFFSAN